MIRRTQNSTRTGALFAYATLCRSRPRPFGVDGGGRVELAPVGDVELDPVALLAGAGDGVPFDYLGAGGAGDVEEGGIELGATGDHRVEALAAGEREGDLATRWRGHDDVVDRLPARDRGRIAAEARSAEHTSELQSLMRIPYAVLCLQNNKSPL